MMMLRQATKKALGLTSRQSTPWPVGISRFYHENVDNPRKVDMGLVGAPKYGDVIDLKMRVDEKTGQITDARFNTFACGSAMASTYLATEWVKGKTMEEVLTIKNPEIAKRLSRPSVMLHCNMLAEDAIKAAVINYKETNGAAAVGEAAQATRGFFLINLYIFTYEIVKDV